MNVGDNVRIKENAETIKAGISGKTGQIYGLTTPSASKVEVMGNPSQDFALHVELDELDRSFWLPEEYLELVDRGMGTEITIGKANFIKEGDGSWSKQ